MCVCVCVCVAAAAAAAVIVSVIVKHPVLPHCVVDGRSRNPLYYFIIIMKMMIRLVIDRVLPTQKLTSLLLRSPAIQYSLCGSLV